jgi:hypothetical protein
MNSILKKLKGGDLRSTGRADEVAEDVIRNPELVVVVFEGLFYDDPVIRMRSADALEKASRRNNSLLNPFKTKLIDEASKINQIEVQWHVAQMLSNLELDEIELEKTINILDKYLESESKIVIVNSLQALADLEKKHPQLKPLAVERIQKMMETGVPSIVSRGKKLLRSLK